MTDQEMTEAFHALNAHEKNFQKGEYILNAGETTDYLAFVQQGSVTIESNDLWGNRTILSLLEPGQFFAETYALLPNQPLFVDAVANEDCRVLFLNMKPLADFSSAKESWKQKIIFQVLNISMQKNIHLSLRSFHTAPKTIRERVMAYLNTYSLQVKSQEFDIPFDRQQMADYLNLERTALSKELGKMQKEGILSYHKNHFTLRKVDGVSM